MSKKKVEGAVKMVSGAGQVVSGAMTAAGKGIVGTAFRNSGMVTSASIYAKESVERGVKKFKEGVEDFRQS